MDITLNEVYHEVNQVKQKMMNGSYRDLYDLLISIDNRLKDVEKKVNSIQLSIDN